MQGYIPEVEAVFDKSRKNLFADLDNMFIGKDEISKLKGTLVEAHQKAKEIIYAELEQNPISDEELVDRIPLYEYVLQKKDFDSYQEIARKFGFSMEPEFYEHTESDEALGIVEKERTMPFGGKNLLVVEKNILGNDTLAVPGYLVSGGPGYSLSTVEPLSETAKAYLGTKLRIDFREEGTDLWGILFFSPKDLDGRRRKPTNASSSTLDFFF